MTDTQRDKMSSDSVIQSVLRECHDRLVEDLCCDTVIQVLHTHGFVSLESQKGFMRERNKAARIRQLLRRLEDSRNDEALEVLIQHLRKEGTQPHLWTLLEYSRAKHRRIQSNNLNSVSKTLHM